MKHLLHLAILVLVPAAMFALAQWSPARRVPVHTARSQPGADPFADAAGLAQRPGTQTLMAANARRRMAVPGSFALKLAVVATASAGAIHAAVTRAHFSQYWLFGVFFVGAAAAQLASASVMAVRPGELALKLSLALNLSLIAVWILSRTSGIPLGPEPWRPEPAGLVDTVSSVFELAAAVSLAALIRTHVKLPRRISLSLAEWAGLVAALAGAFAFALISHHGA